MGKSPRAHHKIACRFPCRDILTPLAVLPRGTLILELCFPPSLPVEPVLPSLGSSQAEMMALSMSEIFHPETVDPTNGAPYGIVDADGHSAGSATLIIVRIADGLPSD